MSEASTPEQPSGNSGVAKITSLAATEQTPADKFRRWRDEITNAEQENKEWHERGRKIVKRYKDDRKGAIDGLDKKFNLFTTNVGIMQAALYAKVPKVLVERKFQDADDDVARVAALIMQRAITQDLDETSCNFSQVMEDAIEDRLVPGGGFAWLRLVVETQQVPVPVEMTPEPSPDMTVPEPQEPETMEEISHQEVVVEHVHWEDFIWSPCRTWAERRWVGRRVYMDKDSLTERFGEEKANRVPLDYSPKLATDSVTPINDVLKKAIVYEIWDRQTRTVLWLSKGMQELLDERDDPLKLEGFEPCPKPLFALTTTSNCVPTADYYLLQDQYKELDDVNDRIASLHRACKVVGVYDKQADGVQRMLGEGSDNQLIPVDNWAMFAEKGGVKGAVDWLPLDTVVNALQNLRQAREDIKGQIYELNGISDVVRGASKASETLGAQQLKANFANIRIQRLQSAAARFASEIFRIKAEILAKHFEPGILLEMSNIKYTEDADNPQVIADAIQLIKSDEAFEWRISVDSDSMKMADYAAEKKERTEFVTSVATYLQSSATILKSEPAAAPLILGMLKYAAAGYAGSKDMEAVIDKTIQDFEQKQKHPDPPPPDPEQQKMQAEMQMEQQRMQMETQSKQIDQQIKQAELQMKSQAEQQKLQMEMIKNEQEMKFAEDKHQQEMIFEREKFQMEMAMKSADAELSKQVKLQEAETRANTAAAVVEAPSKSDNESGQIAKLTELVKKALRPRKHTLKYDKDGIPISSISKVQEDDDE